MSGMITKPPPQLSAPTLNPVQASDPSPAACGAAARLIGPVRPTRISTSRPPQPTSASTTDDPARALAANPAAT